MSALEANDPELRVALDRLFSLQAFGIKLGLESITELLHEFGDVQNSYLTIHVAGTNGKGSVCAMIAAVLQAAGLRVGLYSSPHLVRFHERIRVNGRTITSERLGLYTREMLPVIERIGCTFFEGTTAMAFRYFAEKRVDVAVIETGLGGRLDATNVLCPLVTAVTSIGLDHTRQLGETLEEIAGEKGGIFKLGIPAIVGAVPEHLRRVFMLRADAVGAPLTFVEDCCQGHFRSMNDDGVTASFVIGDRELPDLRIGLVGRHQIDNARVALSVLDWLQTHFAIKDEAIRCGMERIRLLTGIRGRLERVGTRPSVWLDVAHNPDGVRVLTDTMRELGAGTSRCLHVIFGAVQDKDVAGSMQIFAGITHRLYAVTADNHRSLSSAVIAEEARRVGIDVEIAEKVEIGVFRAMHEAADNDLVLICGSFYVVGEAIIALGGE